ncbi:MAG: sulfite exporter TauE/SafE family protein [Candidatus Shapirobacteria bacterium]
MKQHIYKVRGMHCASCELIIEKKLIQLEGVEAVDASTTKETVTVFYKDELPSESLINKVLKEDGYCACESDSKFENVSVSGKGLFTAIGMALLVFFGFLLLNRLGLASLVNVTASLSLPTFLFFGLLAGVSTCAALTGGIVLSMSKSWGGRREPHILFNLGRVVSYALFGAILGITGSKLQFSPTFSAFLVIAVSIFMILTGLKMLGVKALRGFQIALPKSWTRQAVNGQNFQGRYMSLIMGALTILLPCGFTITVESLALLSGNPMQGALIMAAFAVGTAPGLLAIGFSAVKMENSSRSVLFSQIAGALILLFAIFNINSQLNVLSLPSLDNLSIGSSTKGQIIGASDAKDGLAPIVNGKQVLKMNASASGYSPNYFKVRAGTPVRWEITDTGTSGCTNAVMSQSLFEGQIPLTPGQTSVKEFTPAKAGKYKFSCWMGMVTGVMEVINQDGSGVVNTGATAEIPSGAKGCGCGGGGGSSCGGGR